MRINEARMNLESDVSLQNWVEMYLVLEPGESDWTHEEHRELWAEALRLLAKGERVVELSEDQWSSFVARVSEDVANILWHEDDGSTVLRMELLKELPNLVALVVVHTPNDDFRTDVFWESASMLARPVDFSALPGIANQLEPQSSQMFDALFEALSIQLQMADKRLQVSALKGLLRLGHGGTGALVKSVRDRLADEEVRRLADYAARFGNA